MLIIKVVHQIEIFILKNDVHLMIVDGFLKMYMWFKWKLDIFLVVESKDESNI